MLVGISSAIVGTYSLSSGLFIWVVCGVVLLVQESSKKYFLIWAISGLAAIVLYFIGYDKPSHHPSLLSFIQHPYEYLLYVLVYLGRSLSTSLNNSAMIGLLLLTLFVASFIYLASYHPGHLKRSVRWVAIALYSLLTAATTGLARVGFGVEQGGASRYTTISMLFVLSTIVIVTVAIMACFFLPFSPTMGHLPILSSG
ncbi:MAG: hypothetical protein HY226_00485 [Candidatus Vogelbacteria bacterium]|nr:hypothetical protein [Candidatus Vogelbacteria bacterium]